MRRVRIRELWRRGRRSRPALGVLVRFAVVFASLLLPSAAASAPTVSIDPIIRGTLGANGWYIGNVTVNWTITPPPDQSAGCDAVTLRNDGATRLDCRAWWGDVTVDYPLTIKIDKTPPAVGGAASRPPDANGWYNHPLTISFSGTDATSGIASCSSAAYGGPDNATAAVAGSCTDGAGNVGTATFSFAYDATPPTLKKVTLRHLNRSVDLRWTASPDTRLTEITRTSRGKGGKTTTVYRGTGKEYRDKGLRPGAKYLYRVTAFDAASNTAGKTMPVTATGRLLNPVPGERVSSPPRLIWTAVDGASYYNVQVYRDGQIFSAWPRRPSLKLPRSWVYHGRHHRLLAGRYRWYVWPGFGRLAQANYGHLLGRSSFVVSR